jgi:hypothetical protein
VWVHSALPPEDIQMRHTATALALVVTVAVLGAQEPPKPYQEGDVHGFLERTRANGRSAVVLFNFNQDSG